MNETPRDIGPSRTGRPANAPGYPDETSGTHVAGGTQPTPSRTGGTGSQYGSSRPRETGGKTLDDLLLGVEKTAAAVAGALEGYRERVREEHLGEAVGEVAHTMQETRDSVRQAGREEWDTPELRRVGHRVSDTASRAADTVTETGRRTGETVKGTATSVGDTARHARDRTREVAHDARERVHETRERTTEAAQRARERTMEGAHHARERTAEAYHEAEAQVKHAAHDARERTAEAYHEAEAQVKHAAHDVKVKGHAVQESGKRATRAPRMIMRDVKEGVSAMTSNMGKAAAYYMGSALFALTAFILLTIFLVVALNDLLGDPWGTLVTAVLWGLVTWAIIARAQALAGDAKAAKKDMKARVREDVDYVKRPVQREFGGHA